MFKTGDQIFYPAVGVGMVEEIVYRNFGSGDRAFFKIRVRQKKATVMVPMDDFERVGLRPLISADTAGRIFKLFGKVPEADFFKFWSKRFRTYEDRLKSTDPFEIAEVLRDLLLQARHKELSFGEKRVLESARQLLILELSCCTDRTETEVERDLTDHIDLVWSACGDLV